MPSRRPPSSDALTHALLYCRVSTQDQSREGVSLPQQLAACRRYAGDHGWAIGGEFQDVLSGSRDDRPDYQRLLAEARTRCGRGESVVVIVMRLDRFGRRLLERVRAREELKALGVPTHSVADNGEVTDLLSNIMASIAQEEVRLISERTSDAKAHLSRQGWYPGGRPPWGLLLRDATATERLQGAPRRVLDVDPVAAPFVQEAARRLVAGESLHNLARWVSTLPSAARSGRVLGFSRLRDYLESEALRGLHHGQPARWPALIDPATAQAIDARIRRWARGLRQPSGRYLLTGLLRCPQCGAAMAGNRGYGGRRDRYRCFDWRARQSAGGMRCRYGVSMAVTDAAVLAVVTARLAPLGTHDRTQQRSQERAWQALRQPAVPPAAEAQQRALARTREQAQGRLRTAALRLVDGTLDPQGYELVRQQAEADLAAATTASGKPHDNVPVPTPMLPPWATVRAQLGDFAALSARLTVPTLRAVLLELIETVTPRRAAYPAVTVEVEWTALGLALGELAAR